TVIIPLKLVNSTFAPISALDNFSITPASDRLWIGFPEMPDLSLKVTPVVGESKYSYSLIHDFLEARIRDELKTGN
ncbi:unnamed protein product, partial [Rotaria sordida]